MTSGGGKRIKSLMEHLNEVKVKVKVKVKRSARTVFYHFDISDRVAEVVIRLLLNEAKPYVELGKGRAIMHHKAHVPNTLDHLHFLVKGTSIAAINKDGSAHDKSHGVQLQRWAMDGARKHYPDFRIPNDGLIESIFAEDAAMLTEAQNHRQVLLSPKVQAEAENAIR